MAAYTSKSLGIGLITRTIHERLLEVHVVNLRMLANCCVWNYTPVEIRGLRITRLCSH